MPGGGIQASGLGCGGAPEAERCSALKLVFPLKESTKTQGVENRGKGFPLIGRGMIEPPQTPALQDYRSAFYIQVASLTKILL